MVKKNNTQLSSKPFLVCVSTVYALPQSSWSTDATLGEQAGEASELLLAEYFVTLRKTM